MFTIVSAYCYQCSQLSVPTVNSVHNHQCLLLPVFTIISTYCYQCSQSSLPTVTSVHNHQCLPTHFPQLHRGQWPFQNFRTAITSAYYHQCSPSPVLTITRAEHLPTNTFYPTSQRSMTFPKFPNLHHQCLLSSVPTITSAYHWHWW